MPTTQVQSGRAAHAFERITEGYRRSGTDAKEYASSCKKLPMLIKVNGLVPALLFAREKPQFGSKGYSIEEAVMSWLRDSGSPVSQLLQGKSEIGDLTDLTSRQYRLVTAEAQRYLAWAKRFAAARRAEDKAAGDGE